MDLQICYFILRNDYYDYNSWPKARRAQESFCCLKRASSDLLLVRGAKFWIIRLRVFFFAPGCRRIFLAPCVRYRFRLSVYFLCVFRFYGFLSGIIRCYDILPFIFSRFHLWLLQFLSFRPFYVLCYTVQPNAICQSLFFPFRHIFRLLLFFYQMQISLSVQFFLFTW